MLKKKSLITLVSLLAVLCVTVGGTLAFLVDTDGPITNIFNPSEVTTAVTETNQNGVKTNVQIKNTGDTDAYIRAAVVVTWQNEAGEVYGQAPAESDYKIVWGTGWKKHTDGFWYYTSPVAAGASTTNLIDSCSLAENAAVPAGYFLNVEIIGSGIQSKGLSSDNKKPVVEAWSVDPETLK